ncbi:RHS repeat domain-containing protein [Streptomyces sp. NPDC091219]|uniref:RHS repeat domain-containing protein n=1 Tax=Streptomyces sp. NPDC091219 TaxID=3155193 RepID=UPI00344E9904
MARSDGTARPWGPGRTTSSSLCAKAGNTSGRSGRLRHPPRRKRTAHRARPVRSARGGRRAGRRPHAPGVRRTRGNRTAVTNQAGSITRYTYAHAGRLASLTDALGRPIRITELTGKVTGLAWDADGQLARRAGPDGRQPQAGSALHTRPSGQPGQ